MKLRHFQQKFLSRLDGIHAFKELLDQLPDVAFFVKDRKGRFVMNNRRGVDVCKVSSEMETIGKTDFDFFTEDRAQLYWEGDQAVIKSSLPILNAIERSPEASVIEKLIVCSKIPLRDKRKRIIGVAGIHREIEVGRANSLKYGPMSRALQFIHEHYADPIETDQIAAMFGISSSQFARHFRKLFGTSLRQYLLRARVHHACLLLIQTEKPITDIAIEVGFYDNPHFTRTFAKLMGNTPLSYRKSHHNRN